MSARDVLRERVAARLCTHVEPCSACLAAANDVLAAILVDQRAELLALLAEPAACETCDGEGYTWDDEDGGSFDCHDCDNTGSVAVDVLDLLAERAVDPDLAVCDEVWTRCTATATHSEIEQIVEMYLACVALYAPKDGTR